MNRYKVASLVIVLILLPAALSACGGGGTRDESHTGGFEIAPRTQLFEGTYFYMAYDGLWSTQAVRNWWGTIEADGAGWVTGGALSTSAWAEVTAKVVYPFPYEVDIANNIVWTPGYPSERRGGISSDGRVLTLINSAKYSFPSTIIAIRREGTFSAASLDGIYHVLAVSRSPTAGFSYWGMAEFDGSGGVDFSLTRADNENAVSMNSLDFTESYVVEPDGVVRLDMDGQSHQGAILQGSELAVLVGSMEPSDTQSMLVLIRVPVRVPGAVPSGQYHDALLLDWIKGCCPSFRAETHRCKLANDQLQLYPEWPSNENGWIVDHHVGITYWYDVQPGGRFRTMRGSGAISPSGNYMATVSRPELGYESQWSPAFEFFLRSQPKGTLSGP